jgi:hypothetical protein
VDQLPKDAAGWGVLIVAFAFLFLGLGVRRSLNASPQQIEGDDKW